MAYSDYGAFVYKDGERRRDCEDVSVFDRSEADYPSGSRIFANLINRKEQDKHAPWDGCFHAVLGDGPVRLALYKQGLYASHLFAAMPDGKVISVDPEQMLEFAEADIPEVPAYPGDDASDEEKARYYANSHVLNDMLYYNYSYTFDFDGPEGVVSISLSSIQPPDGGDAPKYKAEMREPDGSIWTAFYDVGYGAGHIDRNAFGHEIEECNRYDEERGPVIAKKFGIRTITGELGESETEFSAVLGDIDDKFSIILASARSGDGRSVNSLYYYGEDNYIAPSEVEGLLEMGIALGRAGYTDVTVNSFGHGFAEETLQQMKAEQGGIGADRWREVEPPSNFDEVAGLIYGELLR